jgi:hypothetical protein
LKKRLHKPEKPDIEFTADVKARELRFDEVPETEVHPPAQTERENLPEKIRPEHAGITFYNVGVEVRIASELIASEPDRREDFEEGETERFVRRRDSGKPGYAAEQSKEKARKERKK